MLVLITENQLDEWVRGNAQDAQRVILDLIWRLVSASCPKPRERRFPLSDSMGQHGPDGILDTALGFEPFVPDGRSFWEIGTGLRAGVKATSDYNDLSKAIPESIRRETTFILVTPLSGRRDWEYTWKEEAQAAWLEEHRKKGEWKNVRIIDGTKLTDWLHQSPAVEIWLAQRISNVPVQQVETPEQRWQVLRSIGEPPLLTPDLFLANRADASERIKKVFDGTTPLLRLSTHYPDQVVDFVASYLASLDNEGRVEAASRCLIVAGGGTWSVLCSQYRHRNLVLIADPCLELRGDIGAKLIQEAHTAGHAVIFAGPQGGLPDPVSFPLPMPRSHQVQEWLEKAGYSRERARTLAQRSGGNLSFLLRLLQSGSVTPEWAEWPEAPDLAIAAAVGSWSDKSEADCDSVGVLAERTYEQWIEKMREVALRRGTPITQREGNWKFVPRYEGWYTSGPRFFDEHLERLKAVAVSVLGEKDPQFDLPKENRYAAQMYGKVFKHSHILRNGLAESLALLGSHPKALTSCSLGKAEATVTLAVREILMNADWLQWASLNDVLPLLAEAAPGEFLDALENALENDPCPFDVIFAQEGGGVFGRNYMTGLLWALETLAWDPDCLSRVVICLGELAARDPGGGCGNRPANSLTTILLPWLPQTCASITKRVAAVKALLTEIPSVGWKLLLGLLPEHYSASALTPRPAWRTTIPDDWSDGVTPRDYLEQVSAYAELTINEAKQDISRLTELIDHLHNLPHPALDQILQHLGSDSVIALSEADRLPLWNKLVVLVTRHREYADAEWAMKPELVNRIATIAERLAPEAPFFRYQRLFSKHDFDLYEGNGNFGEQMNRVEESRRRALEAIATSGGSEMVIAFAKTVESAWHVGIAFGAVESSDGDDAILPQFLESKEKSLSEFAGGFVRGRFCSRGWEWVDRIDTSQWASTQICRFLSFLPFTSETWGRAERLLGKDQSTYWSQAVVNPYEANTGLQHSIDQLIQHGRPYEAIFCLHKLLHDNQPLNSHSAVRALLEASKSSESHHSMATYEIVEIVNALQNDPSTNLEEICKVEWAYLQLLDGHHHGALPKFLWRWLADDPQFFCQVIRLVFRPEGEESPAEEVTEQRKNVASNAYLLLRGWRVPPGLREDGSYDGDSLTAWLKTVKEACSKSGHLKVAMGILGRVLIHVPPDHDGLWIHPSAAAVLNAKDAEDLRDEFSMALYTSRGVHYVDPTGKPERELAVQYRAQAEAVESAGYQRLATTLRQLAVTYEREAERVSSREFLDH